MNRLQRIRKGLILAGWIILGAGILTLIIAAMQTKSTKPCRNVIITIKGDKDEQFISKADVALLLDKKGLDQLRGRSIREFNLRAMEEKVENNPWVRNAELFFDNNRNLCVNVDVSEPVARVFTMKGTSFYIDSSLNRLPLSERLSPRLPVFTGFPSEKVPGKGKDSLLLVEMKTVAGFIKNDPLWMAQIEQIDIDGDRGFIMIPKVGDHQIIFGGGDQIEDRFRKLYTFYTRVLAKEGWNSYSTINLKFEGQIVAERRNTRFIKSDTALVRQWNRQWQHMTRQMQLADTLNRVPAKHEPASTPQTRNTVTRSMKDGPSSVNPVPGKSKHSGTKGSGPAETKKPKAVMPEAKNED